MSSENLSGGTTSSTPNIVPEWKLRDLENGQKPMPSFLLWLVLLGQLACQILPGTILQGWGPRRGMATILRLQKTGCSWTQLHHQIRCSAKALLPAWACSFCQIQAGTWSSDHLPFLNLKAEGQTRQFPEEKKFIVLSRPYFHYSSKKFIHISLQVQRALQTFRAPMLVPKQGQHLVLCCI